MAVVDELVAKLGFKVEGLNELKKFDDGFKKADASVKSFGKTLHDRLFGKLAGASTIFPKIANGLRSGVSGAAAFALTIGKVALTIGAMVAGVGLAALAVLKLGQAFVKVRGEAALLRREMQLDAKGNRTTIGNIEKLQKGFSAIGAKPEEAKELIESVAKKVDESIRNKDYGDFKEAGVNPLNPDGSRKDSTGVTIDLLRKYNDLIKSGQDARDRQHSTKDPKKAKRESDIANKKEFEASKFAEKWGLSPELQGAFKALTGGMAEFQKKFDEFNKNNPGPTQDQEDTKERIAKGYAKLENTIQGITNATVGKIGVIADKITDAILPALNGLAEGILKVLKLLGLSPKTQGEIDDGKKRKAEAETESPEVKKAKETAAKANAGAAKREDGPVFKGIPQFLFGLGGNDQEKAQGRFNEAMRRYNIAKKTAVANADQDLPDKIHAFDAGELKDAASGLIAAAKAVEGFKNMISPSENSSKVVKDAAKDIKIDPIKVGGEATVTIPPIKVDASPELKATIAAATAAAKMKITGTSGPTVVKGSNANTALPAAP